MRTQKGTDQQCKDPSQNKQRQRMGGRVQTSKKGIALEATRDSRIARVEFKLGKKEIESRGNKRLVNNKRLEFTGLLLPLDPISFLPGLNSTFLLFTGLF